MTGHQHARWRRRSAAGRRVAPAIAVLIVVAAVLPSVGLFLVPTALAPAAAVALTPEGGAVA